MYENIDISALVDRPESPSTIIRFEDKTDEHAPQLSYSVPLPASYEGRSFLKIELDGLPFSDKAFEGEFKVPEFSGGPTAGTFADRFGSLQRRKAFAHLIRAAVDLGLEYGKKLRVDTTVVETDIHHPRSQLTASHATDLQRPTTTWAFPSLGWPLGRRTNHPLGSSNQRRTAVRKETLCVLR